MIRLAVEKDLDEIVRIYNQAIPGRMATGDQNPVSVESRREWYLEHSENRHPIWIAEDKGKLVGWLSLSHFLRRASWELTAEVSIYVDFNYHHQRVGSELLQTALGRSHSLGLHALVSLVFRHNEPSLSFFSKFGFKEWGLLPETTELENMKRDVFILGRLTPNTIKIS